MIPGMSSSSGIACVTLKRSAILIALGSPFSGCR
jgi:hypothetical protein